MYIFLRMRIDRWVHRNAPAIAFDGLHASHHICQPQDIDAWAELNNGRTLTLYDMGRIAHLRRSGLGAVLRREGWSMAVVGSSVRYRRRVRVCDRLAMLTRLVGQDDKFLYYEQSMWNRGACTSHVLIRKAVTDAAGLVRMDRVRAAAGWPAPAALPGWVAAWAAADAERPWPPMAADAQAEGLA